MIIAYSGTMRSGVMVDCGKGELDLRYCHIIVCDRNPVPWNIMKKYGHKFTGHEIALKISVYEGSLGRASRVVTVMFENENFAAILVEGLAGLDEAGVSPDNNAYDLALEKGWAIPQAKGDLASPEPARRRSSGTWDEAFDPRNSTIHDYMDTVATSPQDDKKEEDGRPSYLGGAERRNSSAESSPVRTPSQRQVAFQESPDLVIRRSPRQRA